MREMNDVRLTQSGLQVNIKSHDNQRELPLNTKKSKQFDTK